MKNAKKIITDCGGEVADGDPEKIDSNIGNTDYQYCYERKGFYSSGGYWSVGLDEDIVWGVNFYNGYDIGSEYKHFSLYVRCIIIDEQ